MYRYWNCLIREPHLKRFIIIVHIRFGPVNWKKKSQKVQEDILDIDGQNVENQKHRKIGYGQPEYRGSDTRFEHRQEFR